MAKNLSWPAVALVAVLGALALGLLSLTDLTAGGVLGIIGVLAGIGGGAAIASGPAGQAQKVEEIHAETQQQTATLDTITRQVNGELTARMEGMAQDAADRAVAEIMTALRDGGVIPRG